MNGQVKKREVFYLSGYDPRGARYYYNLYKKEGELQSKVNGLYLDISSRKRTDKHVQSWEIASTSKEGTTTTNYHFLEWDDIIRDDWKKNVLELFLDLIFYFKTYILAGRFSQYMFSSPYQMIGIFLPSIYVIASLLLTCFISYNAYAYMEGIIGLITSLTLFVLLLYFLIKLGDKLAVFWLLRIFVFSARYAFHENKILESRLEEFYIFIEKHIETASENNIDEILLVAHSVGAILIIPLLKKLLKNYEKKLNIKLSILVLGECIPLVSCINKAVDYKSKMEYIAQSNELFWLDYTTVIDGACFPQLNYFEDANINIKNKENFHFYPGRFYSLFSKESYKSIRKNKYLTHFIYFMATEISGGYDFFSMTAGHKRLKEKVKNGK